MKIEVKYITLSIKEKNNEAIEKILRYATLSTIQQNEIYRYLISTKNMDLLYLYTTFYSVSHPNQALELFSMDKLHKNIYSNIIKGLNKHYKDK